MCFSVFFQSRNYRKIENCLFWRSWEFLDTTGVSAMKNDPRWKDFRVSTTFGGGVKGDISIFFSTFDQTKKSQFRENDVALRSCEIAKKWKTVNFEELGIFRHHRHVGHEKWPPMKRFSSLYDVWRRGKRWHYDFFLDFWPKIIFTISRKWCCITKMPVASRLSGVQTNSPQKDFDVARNLLQKTFSRKFFTLRRTVFFYKRFFPLGIFLQRFFFQKLFFPLGIFFPREAFFFFEERWPRLGYREPLSLSSSAEPQS